MDGEVGRRDTNANNFQYNKNKMGLPANRVNISRNILGSMFIFWSSTRICLYRTLTVNGVTKTCKLITKQSFDQ